MKKVVIFLVFGILFLGITGIAYAKAENAPSGLGAKSLNRSQNATDLSNQTENVGDGQDNSSGSNGKTIVNQSRTRMQNRTNLTFVPWQKRNESECMDGCTCRGAVVSCTTENGKIMTITAGKSGNTIVITVDKTNVTTEMELEQELGEGNRTRIHAKLKNGERKEVKIMPNEAEKAFLERVRLRACNSESNCNLTLKEEKNQIKYVLQIERHSRIFAIFSRKMQVRSEIDAETGAVTNVAKPWWAFLATEPKE